MTISVVLAAYNGEKYICEQIASILPQLGESGELIVVDDSSVDGTKAVVAQFGDSRIRVIANEANEGVLKTFERGLRAAENDILFLSDQDDIWKPYKVDETCTIFSNYPEVTLVLSDTEVIDSAGILMRDSFFASRGRFRSGVISNIIKNKYLGCTMAFRRLVLDWVLPFPSYIPMHDMWIGIVNEMLGKTYYIDKPLMSYRRHNANTSIDGGSWSDKVRWRWRLIRGLSAAVRE